MLVSYLEVALEVENGHRTKCFEIEGTGQVSIVDSHDVVDGVLDIGWEFFIHMYMIPPCLLRCVCGRGVERSSEKLALAGFEEERSGVEDCPWSQAARIRINGFLILIFTA